MKATRSSETSGYNKSARRQIPEYGIRQISDTYQQVVAFSINNSVTSLVI
jgi:hypothetical protein